MRGNQVFQGAMFSYISLEERVPQAHPLRKQRSMVDALLATMNSEFEAACARRGRPSLPPEILLKALLVQILFSIRSERQLVESVTHANSTAEREAALAILGRRGKKNKRATVGADKDYDCKALAKGCRRRNVTPHVAAKDKYSAIDGPTKRHEGYRQSLKMRKRIEEAFGRIKTVGGMAKTKLVAHATLSVQALPCFAIYNPIRMGSLGGRWDAHHA